MGVHLCTSTSMFFLLFLFLLVSSVQPLCRPDERLALMQFRESFVINKTASSSSGAYSKTGSWESVECCSWEGVECDNATGHVIGLNLTSSYLYGSFNSHSTLFHLVHLQSLHLGDNVFLNSEIPSGITNLSRLMALDLSYSNFSGRVPPEIMELSELEILYLGGNSLEFQKPGLSSLLYNLTNLEELDLSEVRISSTVPNILANLTSLTALNLSNCDLHGELPPGIFELPSLQTLYLDSNPYLSGYLPDIQENHPLSILKLASTSFSGKLPESIGNFKSLEVFDINNCYFSGEVPHSIGNLTELQYLYLSVNNFSGSIPPSIGNLNQLTELDLSYNTFPGKIPSSLANLTQLLCLSLSTNHFDHGNISWLGTQTNLTNLDLSETNLTGNIPSSLKNLTQISNLYLRTNGLDGQIPTWIGSLTKLVEIKLQENFLSGSIPKSIFKLENLQLLDLQKNRLNGTLQLGSFLELKNLFRLQLSGNNLSLLNNGRFNATQRFKLLGLAACNLSEFPDFLRNQDKLEFLELAENRIHGQIPKWFFNVGNKTLRYLNLGYNFLTRFEEIPTVLPWTRLEVFKLDFNMFQGSLPHPPPSIISYDVSNNLLSGEIPLKLCNLSSLLVLDLSSNNLTGKLPHCLVSLSESLKVLSLQNNSFIGSIPSIYKKSCSLWTMDLSQNRLQGRIPRSLANCSQLQVINLGNNFINDTFPSWSARLPNLRILMLRSNGLHGVIEKPQAKLGFSKLQVIDLSDNNLRGKLPSEHFKIWTAMEVASTSSSSAYMNANTSFGNSEYLWIDYYNYIVTLANRGRDLKYDNTPDSMSAIDLSCNKFQGQIPESIGKLKMIHFLNLSNNDLNGPIPSSLGDITNLESLDLSRNKLFGRIPQQLTNLNFLAKFNVSYNNLEGPIPRAEQFHTFSNDSYEGNPRLCGEPLSKKCGNSEILPPPPPSASEEDEGIAGAFQCGWKAVLTGYGGGLIVGMSLGYKFNVRRLYEWFRKVFRKRQVISNSRSESSWYESLSFIWNKISWNFSRL